VGCFSHCHQILALRILLRVDRSRNTIPPAYLGLQILSQLIKAHLCPYLVTYCINFLCKFFMVVRMNLGATREEKEYMGRDWSTEWRRIRWPERFKERNVQEDSLFPKLVRRSSQEVFFWALSMSKIPRKEGRLCWKPRARSCEIEQGSACWKRRFAIYPCWCPWERHRKRFGEYLEFGGPCRQWEHP